MKEYLHILVRSDLFTGLSPQDIETILPCLHPRQAEYGRGEIVIGEGDTVRDIGVVLSGHGRSVKTDVAGRTVIVTLLRPGSYIGVLLASSRDRKSPVSVQALEGLTVLFLPIEHMIRRCPRVCKKHDRLLDNLLHGIAEKALVLHDRNDCLIKHSVREKILTYLNRVAKERKSHDVTIPLDRNAMAEYLNVERSSLSRELSRMRREGLIWFHKNQFTLRGRND